MRELRPSNRTPSVPPTFADGTNTTSNPQSKGTYGSSDSKGAGASLGSKLKRVFSSNNKHSSELKDGGRREKLEHSRHLSNSSVQILTTLGTQIDPNEVEMGRISYSRNQKPDYDRQDSTTSTLEKGYIPRGSSFHPVGENEDGVIDQAQDQNQRSSIPSIPLSRMATRTTARTSFASAREEIVDEETERISSSQLRTDTPMIGSSLRRDSSGSELPPFTRRPSRDGGFLEFGFADQNSGEDGLGRGPKVTTSNLWRHRYSLMINWSIFSALPWFSILSCPVSNLYML